RAAVPSVACSVAGSVRGDLLFLLRPASRTCNAGAGATDRAGPGHRHSGDEGADGICGRPPGRIGKSRRFSGRSSTDPARRVLHCDRRIGRSRRTTAGTAFHLLCSAAGDGGANANSLDEIEIFFIRILLWGFVHLYASTIDGDAVEDWNRSVRNEVS